MKKKKKKIHRADGRTETVCDDQNLFPPPCRLVKRCG